MRHHTQHEQALRHRISPYIDARRCTALYARLMQARLGPKHASNLTNVTPHDTFQPCHWPLLAYVALHVLHCVLLEIQLNAGSVVLEGTATRRGGILSCGDRRPYRAFGRRVSRPNARHVGPFYCDKLWFFHTAKHLRIVSYRIISRYFVWYRIVSIVFSYGCIVPSLMLHYVCKLCTYKHT